MINTTLSNPLNSTKLFLMDRYLNEMVDLHNLKKFPKILLLNGKKGIGKFTLAIHFLNYIFTHQEKNAYNLEDKSINPDSVFYNQLLNQTNQDVLLIKAEENKNIKIEEIRNLKSILSRTSLSRKPRFVIIDEVEYINESSANALLKSLEEPTENNFFILINNQQSDLIKTISSRCIMNNIFITSNEADIIINHIFKKKKIEKLIDFDRNLTPGLFVLYNEIYLKNNINKADNVLDKINKLLFAYKKNKDKTLINLTLFLIDQYFLLSLQNNQNQLDSLLIIKSSIIKNINDFIYLNLNINSVLNSIEVKLQNV